MPETDDRQHFDRSLSPMRWLRTYGPHFLAVMSLALLGIGGLGDLDTACGIGGLPSGQCGSIPLIAFLLNPPAWFLAICILLALISFAFGESGRHQAATARAASALKSEWALYKEATERFDDRVLALEDGMRAILERLQPTETQLADLEKSASSQGERVDVIERLCTGLNQEVKTNKKAAEDRSVSDIEVIRRTMVNPVEERVANIESKLGGVR